MREPKFYICKHCGNLVGVIHDGGVNPVCCGEKMTLLVPNTTDAAHEKHVPVIHQDGNTVTVTVGSVEHPMTDAHLIQWIYLCSDNGGQRKELNPGEHPSATFALTDGKPLSVYAYCNLHGLWKADV
jgi:superoxide reductase